MDFLKAMLVNKRKKHIYKFKDSNGADVQVSFDDYFKAIREKLKEEIGLKTEQNRFEIDYKYYYFLFEELLQLIEKYIPVEIEGEL